MPNEYRMNGRTNEFMEKNLHKSMSGVLDLPGGHNLSATIIANVFDYFVQARCGRNRNSLSIKEAHLKPSQRLGSLGAVSSAG